ncbi:MAG TPA: chemotaxis protein CheW [Anaeromyxobacteraceae bacterium]|jgi:purine-binding chemotaxis protein CheW|nr:chemotaxis protein CheW [Anaeromyxobacteraceae bacterium]
MDFLKIRKQAKERSEARARAASADRATESLPVSNQVAVPFPPLDLPSPVRIPIDLPPTTRVVREEQPPPGPPNLVPLASPSMMPLEEEPPAPAPLLASSPAPVWSPSMLPPEPPIHEPPAVQPLIPPALPAVPAPSAPAPSAPRGDALAEFFFDEHEAGPAVPDLGGDPLAEARSGEPAEERREYLAFRLGGEEYAFGIEAIREILKAPPITEVPRAPAHVLGVITVRGEVIPVFDPRHRLGLPPAGPGGGPGRVIICDAGEGPCGLLVDAVAQVVRLPPSAIEQKPQGIVGSSSEYIAGIGRDRDRLFILLDLAAVLRFSRAKEALAT